jgi:hypothetical protein
VCSDCDPPEEPARPLPDYEPPRGFELLGRRGYRSQVVTLSDGQFYWHVWRYGERVNGGLSSTWDSALDDAAHAAQADVIDQRILRGRPL